MNRQIKRGVQQRPDGTFVIAKRGMKSLNEVQRDEIAVFVTMVRKEEREKSDELYAKRRAPLFAALAGGMLAGELVIIVMFAALQGKL